MHLATIAADAKKFDDAMQKLETQYYSDIEARKLTNTSDKQINARFSDAGAGVNLQKVACGVLICAAQLSGRQHSQTDFADLLLHAGEQRLYSAIPR